MRARNLVGVLAGLVCLALPASALAQMATNPGVRFMPPVRSQHRICDADGDDCRSVPNAPAGYHQQCDRDRDHCWWVSNNQHNWNSHYACDADGDDCHWTQGYGSQYWRTRGGYDYGPPFAWYRAEPPGHFSLQRRREWLIKRRRIAYSEMQKMRSRGDTDAQQRLQSVIEELNSRIGQINRKLSYR